MFPFAGVWKDPNSHRHRVAIFILAPPTDYRLSHLFIKMPSYGLILADPVYAFKLPVP